MKRILIIGSNGAGKSTFSYTLAQKLNLPLIHIDQIYWHGSWQVTPDEEFRSRVLAEAMKPEWIIEGNNIRSLEQRLRFADTVIWFEFPPFRCLLNILKRERIYKGKARPDMPEDCISRLDLKFLIYAWKFNRTNRERIESLLANADGISVIRLKSRREAMRYLEGLQAVSS